MNDRGTFAQFVRKRQTRIGLGLMVILALLALAVPLLSHHDPYASDFVRGASSNGEPLGPSPAFLLGTDRLFRDELVRLAVATRISFYIASIASTVAMAIGAAVGVVAGFFEGTWIDTILMRLVDVGLSFPFLLLVMAVGAATDRTGSTSILLILGLTGWLSSARIVRAKVLQLRTGEFISAARALGARNPWILVRHILPNVATTVLVLFALSMPQMIMADSVLSYLGAGISPPEPTLGYMLFEGQDVYFSYPWILLAPATAIVTAVLALSLLGNALRDAFDPKRTTAK